MGWATTGCVGLLALIAGTVSYLHMHLLVELHGQAGWVAALTPVHRSATDRGKPQSRKPGLPGSRGTPCSRRYGARGPASTGWAVAGRDLPALVVWAGELQQQAGQWALAHRASDGSLPSGSRVVGQVWPVGAMGPSGQTRGHRGWVRQ